MKNNVKKLSKLAKRLLPIVILFVWINICYNYSWGNKGLWGAILLYIGVGIMIIVRRWKTYLKALDFVGSHVDLYKLKNKTGRNK